MGRSAIPVCGKGFIVNKKIKFPTFLRLVDNYIWRHSFRFGRDSEAEGFSFFANLFRGWFKSCWCSVAFWVKCGVQWHNVSLAGWLSDSTGQNDYF